MGQRRQNCAALVGAAIVALMLGIGSAEANGSRHAGGFGHAYGSFSHFDGSWRPGAPHGNSRHDGGWHGGNWRGGDWRRGGWRRNESWHGRRGSFATIDRFGRHHGHFRRGDGIPAFHRGIPAFHHRERSGFDRSRRWGHRRLFRAPPTIWRTESFGDGVGSWHSTGRDWRAGDRSFDVPYDGDGAGVRLPGVGTYVGGLYAYRDPGNGNFFYVDSGYEQQWPSPSRRGGPKIITVTPGIGDAACHYEAGVCVIRP